MKFQVYLDRMNDDHTVNLILKGFADVTDLRVRHGSARNKPKISLNAFTNWSVGGFTKLGQSINIVPTVTQSHTGLHDRPVENSRSNSNSDRTLALPVQFRDRVAHRRRSAILTCAPLTAMFKRLLEVTM